MSKTFTVQAPIDIYGAFWRPEEKDKPFTGRLARNGNFLQLTTSPVYKETLNLETLAVGPKEDQIEILHGFTTVGPCALLWLQSPQEGGLTDADTLRALVFRQYRVGLCVFDVLPTTPESSFFGEAMFGFSGLHEWLPVVPTVNRLDTGELIISYPNRPSLLEFTLPAIDTSFKLDIIPVMQHQRSGEMRSRHQSQLIVAPATPQPA